MKNIMSRLPGVLLDWYQENKRDLPWRQDKEPYHVWLSEIMLQQTRVEAVKGYYRRFLQVLPTVESLASSPEDALYKLWEGLGYYSRVRNLKKAAQTIVDKYDGRFPNTYKQVLELPGIGDYTAGAICSICFDLPTPAVDGNVMRVMSRLMDDAAPIDTQTQKRKMKDLLAGCYPHQAGDFTQALMELGATLCGPNREPQCHACPCKEFCLGAIRGTASALPVKTPKKPRTLQDRTVFILRCGDSYAVCKRPDKGLLAGLWQFPDVEGRLDLEQSLDAVRTMGMEPTNVLRQSEKIHVFTHVQWNMRGWYMDVDRQAPDLMWVSGAELDTRFALPTAYRQFWEPDVK